MAAHKIPLADRFWNKVDKAPGYGPRGDCWRWMASLNKDGYGAIKVGGTLGAHRVSWEFVNGEIPAGLQVLHRCDNPPCVNPAHLFTGDHVANMRDAVEKGRTKGGNHRILSDGQVRNIRQRFDPFTMKYADLAAEYGVSRYTIGDIITHRTFRHIL